VPLTRDEFDAGGDPGTHVLAFLRASGDKAYTIGELAAEFHDSDVTLDDIDYALSILVENEAIESRPRDGKVYYMYRLTGD
jgi:DNA-binding transcriptional ArsR family regulator